MVRPLCHQSNRKGATDLVSKSILIKTELCEKKHYVPCPCSQCTRGTIHWSVFGCAVNAHTNAMH